MSLNQRSAELAHRRQQLMVRSGQLRQQATSQAVTLQTALSWADRLQTAWRWLQTNPLPVLGGALGLAAWRPRRALHWAWRAWTGWQWLQRLRAGRQAGAGLF
jgi:hypothetical protein